MLSKEDLIFFGTCILMSNSAGSIDTATSIAKTIYNKIFEDDNKEKMIVE